MKYCVSYYRKFKYLDQIDELMIEYVSQEEQTLLDFLLELPKGKRINIYITKESEFLITDRIKTFEKIAAEHPELNFVFMLNDFVNATFSQRNEIEKIINLLRNSKHDFKYFFQTYVNNWEILYLLLDFEPSDMYIVENLGFEIKAVANLLHSRNVQIRAFPNVAQSAWYNMPALKKFFIRPEDVPFYEPYVDVLEFFGIEEALSVAYKIYTIDQKWFGKLNELIFSFNADIDSRCLLPSFAERRLNCGKRCLKGKPCTICEVTEELAKVMEENDLYFGGDLSNDGTTEIKEESSTDILNAEAETSAEN